MLCPVLKKTGLFSGKRHVSVFGRQECENEPITKFMSSITKEKEVRKNLEGGSGIRAVSVGCL